MFTSQRKSSAPDRETLVSNRGRTDKELYAKKQEK